ncbi:NAD-dependent epimerase/dehydratase family protein [Gordonia sp. NPDC127522]|uniref:NAD-dependent epimerase/dehydratase family protein n=1 Tax=Gordonia sp. NPDC127522 TaxID=3345390 RepID=UPI00362A498A
MKVVVTGAAGFVGSTLSETLLQRADVNQVIGIDSLTENYSRDRKLANLASLRDQDRFTFLEADLLAVDIDDLVSGATYIFHQAGQPGVRGSWGQSFSDYTDRNITATQRLLEAAKKSSDLRRFVYASSSSVYGNSVRFPTSEGDLPRPFSPYGVTKLAAEHLCTLYAENYEVPTVSLRYFTVYGPRQRPDMAFDKFLRAAFRGDPIHVYGSGQQIRDFTYVDDIVMGNLAAATTNLEPGSVYNLCGGSSVSLECVLEMLSSITGEKLIIERRTPVAGDVFKTGGVAEAAKADLRWRPSVDLATGLQRQADYVQRSSLTREQRTSTIK